MITEKENQATLLSPTNKDYYSIWKELLETAGKISERWIPESTNESDPGIVLLKVLTACADKLNYNIDKNILEAFMPSAAQEESMRKLTEMMGYSMKYYQSATTDVTLSYANSSDEFGSGELKLPKFTIFTNQDNDISYVSTSEITFNLQNTVQKVNCIEGTVGVCEEENNGIVSINNIDDNYRYYLPISNVAQNGIFIANYVEGSAGEEWEQVDNLNSQALGKRYFKFGYDSKEMLPYIQFPEDISSLISDGLIIEYIATNGVNGNISAKTISTFTIPSGWDVAESNSNNTTGFAHTADEFYVYNTIAATNGSDKESLNNAYKNFKKTVGTFDTLVTCRDYMNKIYELTVSSTDTTNVVSNIVVSDIRDDINKSITICSFNEFGINYVDTPLSYNENRTVKSTEGTEFTFSETYNAIDNFQLILYPFKKIYGLNTNDEYKNSFKYDKTVYNDIKNELSENKTISHELILPEESPKYEESGFADIVAIKNYLKLKAIITTTEKINSAEYNYILNNIKKSIYENFNARNIDFGEEIPFENILSVIEGADTRIKNVSLEEPVLYTRFTLANNREYDTAISYAQADEAKMKAIMSASELEAYNGKTSADKDAYRKERYYLSNKIYNKLALRNILAGRISLFNYNTEFVPSVTETKLNNYAILYPTDSNSIKYVTSRLIINNIPKAAADDTNIKLKDNQIIQFRAPNFKSTITYPAYVNYFIKIDGETVDAIPATFITLYSYMNNNGHAKFKAFMDTKMNRAGEEIKVDETKLSSCITNYGCVFSRRENPEKAGEYEYTAVTAPKAGTNYYLYQLTNDISYAVYYNWIKDQKGLHDAELNGLYKSLGSDQTRTIGKMIDANKIKYQLCSAYNTVAQPFVYFYVQETHSDESKEHTKDGLGKDAEYKGITANEEYQLKTDEYLCINYTNGTSSVETVDSGDNVINTDSTVVNTYYGPGTIIKPNVELINSASVRSSGKSYQKTSGYDFKAYIGQADLPGMYSLGANEQIEVRKQVQTYIYDNTPITGAVYIYFKLNNEGKDGETVTFIEPGQSRILEEGEYFWYTDKNKSILNYFGSGNEIWNLTDFALTKKADSSSVSVESILEKGLAVIPWIKLSKLTIADPDAPKTTDKYIKVDEYQYLTLIATDILKQATISNSGSETTTLNNSWRNCSKVKYICDGTEGELPSFKIKDASGNDIGWQARTKLVVNSGPSTMQTLYKCSYHESSEYDDPSYANCDEHVYMFSSKPTDYYPESGFLAHLNENNLSFKTNYTLNDSADLLQTYYNLDNSNDSIDDFKFKVFKYNTVYIEENLGDEKKEPLNLNNMSTYFTSFPFTNGVYNEKYSTLRCVLTKENQYALLMFYYVSSSTTISENVYIKLTNSITPVIFNNYSGENESWWSSYSSSGKYYFKPNTLNVVKLTGNCDVEIYCGKNTDDAIIFSPLRLVDVNNNDYGINNSLICYKKASDSVNAEKQLLDDIRKKDPKFTFFYNAVLDDSVAIDINTYADETLATEQMWYDYNNINNKFVISEIDADYMDTGITLARSSTKLV